jgi:hypothetical protein
MGWTELIRTGGLLAMLAASGWVQAQTAEAWRDVYSVAAVSVEAAHTESGFDRHRGRVALCGDLDDVVSFAADVEGYPNWVAYTRDARLIEQTAERTVFYLQNSAPWPMRPRDMVYELVPEVIDANQVRVVMIGVPDALPPEDGVVRMELAEGDWLFTADNAGELEVQLSLYVLPGRAPKLFANRRFAHMIGDTLAALAVHFPCSTSLGDAG